MMRDFLEALTPRAVYPQSSVAWWLIKAGNAMDLDGHDDVARLLWDRGRALREATP